MERVGAARAALRTHGNLHIVSDSSTLAHADSLVLIVRCPAHLRLLRSSHRQVYRIFIHLRVETLQVHAVQRNHTQRVVGRFQHGEGDLIDHRLAVACRYGDTRSTVEPAGYDAYRLILIALFHRDCRQCLRADGQLHVVLHLIGREALQRHAVQEDVLQRLHLGLLGADNDFIDTLVAIGSRNDDASSAIQPAIFHRNGLIRVARHIGNLR